MREIIDKFKAMSESTDLGLYVAKAKLSLSIFKFDGDIYVAKTVPVKFKIEMEHREWGIKDIDIYFPEKLPVIYSKEGTDSDTSLLIDLNDADKNWSEASWMGVQEVEIELKPDETVDKVIVWMFYASPAKL